MDPGQSRGEGLHSRHFLFFANLMLFCWVFPPSHGVTPRGNTHNGKTERFFVSPTVCQWKYSPEKQGKIILKRKKKSAQFEEEKGLCCCWWMPCGKVLLAAKFLLKIRREIRGNGIKPFLEPPGIAQAGASLWFRNHCRDVRGHGQDFIPPFHHL